jgi:transcriptional regulator
LYIPEHFREARPEVLHALIRRHALAALVAVTPAGLTANHIPMRISLKNGATLLLGHIARGNPLWREVPDGSQVLAVFRGADHYITPTSYPSKKTTGKAVPTWNYSAVHVHGNIRFIQDRQWLLSLVTALTDEQERNQAEPWHVSDAPADYIEQMLGAIVGIEVEVTRIDGKVKGSQNRAEADRLGAAAILKDQGVSPADILELTPPP